MKKRKVSQMSNSLHDLGYTIINVGIDIPNDVMNYICKKS